MFDLEFKKQAACCICRQRHEEPSKTCEEVKAVLWMFLDDYRLGFGDKYNFDVTLVVRGSKIVYVGNPDKAPVKLKHKPVC